MLENNYVFFMLRSKQIFAEKFFSFNTSFNFIYPFVAICLIRMGPAIRCLYPSIVEKSAIFG